MFPIFDTHAHYDDEEFDGDRDSILSELPGKGIAKLVDVGSSLESSMKACALAEKYPHVYCAVGVHPSETAGLNEDNFIQLKNKCLHEKCVAVGEIGLDYHWNEPSPALQKKWFVRQLALAREINKPVIIHSRDAAKDTVDIMTAENAGETGGVVHCYSYTKETARTFLNMGFYFGIGGVLTFKNARRLKEAVDYIPLDIIVLETDCPYLAPEPHRGHRNTSEYIPYVVTALAEIKGISEAEVREAAWENSHRLYRMRSV